MARTPIAANPAAWTGGWNNPTSRKTAMVPTEIPNEVQIRVLLEALFDQAFAGSNVIENIALAISIRYGTSAIEPSITILEEMHAKGERMWGNSYHPMFWLLKEAIHWGCRSHSSTQVVRIARMLEWVEAQKDRDIECKIEQIIRCSPVQTVVPILEMMKANKLLSLGSWDEVITLCKNAPQ